MTKKSKGNGKVEPKTETKKDNSAEIKVLEAQIKEIEKGERKKLEDELDVVYEKSSLLEDIFFDEDVKSGCKDMIKELTKMQKLIDKEKMKLSVAPLVEAAKKLMAVGEELNKKVGALGKDTNKQVAVLDKKKKDAVDEKINKLRDKIRKLKGEPKRPELPSFTF